MRTAFIEALCEVAAKDPRVWLLTGDLGYSVLEAFSSAHPRRFVNAGVAEQNMTGVAAGLALAGNVVFTYSIANFPTLRCLEQIRNDVVYHQLPVKIVAIGGGLTYGTHGYSHHGVEDLAAMRMLPGMTVLAPGDPYETRCAVEAVVRQPGPCYLRLGKAGEPTVHHHRASFEVGKAIKLSDGQDVTLISTGGMLAQTVATAERLSERGISCRVLSMHTVKPLDAQAVRDAAAQTGAVVTVEEHSVVGGLGSAVAEVLAEIRGTRAPLFRFGLPDAISHRIGSPAFLWEAVGTLDDFVARNLHSSGAR